jgi:hypothetical protein
MSRVYVLSESAQVQLKSGRVSAPASRLLEFAKANFERAGMARHTSLATS